MQIALELGGHWPDHTRSIDNLFPEMLEVVKLADTLGFDAFVMGEHHFMDYNATPDPIALASYIAAMTKRQRMILAVMLLPIHDVQRLAGELTMLDQITRGRIDVGFGRGGGPYELRRFNMPSDYETAREIFEERLHAMRVLFTEQDITLDLPHTKFKDVTIVPPVYQKPYPPIWMSAQRVEAAFHIAKQGYHVMMSQLRNPISYVQEMMDAFRSGVSQADPHQGAQKIAIIQWLYIAKDEADRKHKVELAYQKHRKFVGLFNDSSTVKGGHVPPVDIPGTPEEYAENTLIGTLDQVTEKVIQLKEIGFDYLMLQVHCGPDHQDIMDSMHRFGEHIMPLAHTPEEAKIAASS